ncbi:hypothetical protein HYH02_013819, partial [Chlamydomonas schloesseri]
VTHIAPEGFKKGVRIDASVDVFSFGIIMWELVCGRGYRPYKELELDDIPAAVQAGARPVFPPGAHVPSAYKQLAAACWSQEPHRRPSAADVVSVVKEWLNAVRD